MRAPLPKKIDFYVFAYVVRIMPALDAEVQVLE
jgi:hypothetical protein